MSYLKPSIGAVLLVLTISSTAFAGNIVPRSGNIVPARTGNIVPARTGNIVPARTGNIVPARTGNIVPARIGIVPIQPTDSSLDTRGRFGFNFLIELLLESGLLF